MVKMVFNPVLVTENSELKSLRQTIEHQIFVKKRYTSHYFDREVKVR